MNSSLIFYIEYGYDEIEVKVNYDIGLNGIGHYECHGYKGFDKGETEALINEYTWDKAGKSEAQISEIERLIQDNESDLIVEILESHVDPADCRGDELADRMRDEGY